MPLYTTNETDIKAFDTAKDIDKSESFREIVLNLTHSVKMEFGAGHYIASVGWHNAGTKNVVLGPTNDVTLYELNTDAIKLKDLSNYYMYENFGLFVDNTKVYWPLVNVSKKCNISFTFRPDTTNGRLYMYSNPVGTTNLVNQQFSVNGAAKSTYKDLTKSTLYTISADIGNNQNVILQWVPSTSVGGSNKFTTSQNIEMLYDE